MEALRGVDVNAPQRLTRLYTSAKISYKHAVPSSNAHEPPEVVSLNRKARIQKDRLVAWGLEWSDSSDSTHGNIDRFVEEAGLTEVVESVLENILQTVADLERIQQRPAPVKIDVYHQPEKPPIAQWTASDVAQYEDLIQDLTKALDLLCDLSRARRASTSAHPPSNLPPDLANPSCHEDATLSRPEALAWQQLPAEKAAVPLQDSLSIESLRIDRSALTLPEEAPPPYDSFGLPTSVRTVGKLKRRASGRSSKHGSHYGETVSVLVEYAGFDKVYMNTGVPLPLNRLENLAKLLAASSNPPQCLLPLLGYFEDPSRPRMGLVYEIPAHLRLPEMQPNFQATQIQTRSLSDLLQIASKPPSNTTSSAAFVQPALEDRFRLAMELIHGFSHLLKNGFTHRDVNSSSITFFPNPEHQASQSMTSSRVNHSIRQPVLCSYDLFTEYDIDDSPENLHQNIYRHPDDPHMKGPDSSNQHDARFEIYSLGLVLLEIGLWLPLADIFKEKYSLRDFSVRLEKIWIRKLAAKCGTPYMRAVHECFRAGNDSSFSATSLEQCFDSVSRHLQLCCLFDDGGQELNSLDHNAKATDGASISTDLIRADTLADENIPSGDQPSLLRSTSHEKQLHLVQSPEAENGDIAGAWPARPLEPDFEVSQSIAAHTAHAPVTSKRFCFTDCNLSRDVLDQWPALGRRLSKIVSKALKDSKESLSIGMESTGETESTAKPTLCVMCTSTRRVHRAIQRHFQFDKDKFDLIVMRGKIVRSKSTPGKEGVRRSCRRVPSDVEAKNAAHHIRPSCGASIGAWRDYEHLPPASFGGIVMVDDEPYGMSVHHMLENSSDEQDDDDDEAHDRHSEAGDSANISSAAAKDDETSSDVSESEFDPNFDEDSEDEGEEFEDGDTAGIDQGEGEEILITQPALDDVDADFFPVEEDKDDDHLDSHGLGYVHASSGIRRFTHDGIEHEVDWALLKLRDDRLQPYNLVPGGRRFCSSMDSKSSDRLVEPICRAPYFPEDDLFPNYIVRSQEMGGLPVHCFGRTSGLGNGRISKAMKFVRMQGRRTWSESWTIEGNIGVPGDSGAWVVENDNGRICGHVLAWSTQWQMAYISPMDISFRHMKQTLGAKKISLPTTETKPNSDDVKMEATIRRTSIDLDEPPKLDMPDLSRLSMQESPSQSRAHSQHFLLTGKETHLEKEWALRRHALGQAAR